MGIVAYCPNGHRVKVKDELAGRKGICPECQARFRIPRDAAQAAGRGPQAASAGYPTARVVSLDPDVAAALPRAIPLGAAARSNVQAAQPAPPAAVLHPALAEDPRLTWCVAVPGGQPSAPMAGEAMQKWLEAGGLSGNELVWREGWANWVSIRLVFPEFVPAAGG